MTNARTRTRPTASRRPLARLGIACLVAGLTLAIAAPDAAAQRGGRSDDDKLVPPTTNPPRDAKSPIMPYVFGGVLILLVVVPNVLSSKRGHQD